MQPLKGGNGTIIPSDYNPKKSNPAILDIQSLHGKVSGNWNSKAPDIPRLFTVDCCRGNVLGGAVNRSYGNYVHKDNLLCTLYGNSPGVSVEENNNGGMFSQCLIDVLKDNIDNNKKYTLSEITILAREKLKELSVENQLISKEGDPKMDTIVFRRGK